MGVRRTSEEETSTYASPARLTLSVHFYSPRYWTLQRSGDLPKFTELVGGGARRKTHRRCSFYSRRLCLRVVVWLSIPTAGREKAVWPVQYSRPEHKGKSFGCLAQPPTVWSSANVPHGKLSCLPSSEPPLLWLVPASTACLLLLLPSDQQLFYVSSHCASPHLCSPSAHLLRTAHLHVIEGRLCLWAVIMFLNSPMKWNLKGPARRGTHINHHFSPYLSLALGPLWLLHIRKFKPRVSLSLSFF